MLRADFFERFGMLVVKEFLDDETCRRLRRAVRTAVPTRAAVWNKEIGKIVDEDARRTTRAKVTKRIESFVERRLLALRPRVARHFGVTLRGVQTPQFLVYGPGDFFECHSDSNPDPNAPRYLQERCVTAVLFLNGSRRRRGGEASTGGGLTFPGLIEEPRLKSRGFPVQAEAGTLIAFRSELAHGVTPVSCGERYTVVGWYV
jgi:SM-20-related protein